jgi:hypothetical protein
MPGVHRRQFLALLGTAPLARFAPPALSRLILLGTAGGPTPKTTRSGPSQIIVIGDRGYVIDCGDGVARQMMAAGVFRTLWHVFITHHHLITTRTTGRKAAAGGRRAADAGGHVGPPPLARMTDLFLRMSAAGSDGS